MASTRITAPDDPLLDHLCRELAARTADLDISGDWPRAQLDLCGRYGVFEWFMPLEFGGQAWSEADIIRGYLRLSAACLTTTFIITQRSGACRRVADSPHGDLKASLLPGLISGETFATVGISHLTTSRRHLGRPAMQAEETADGFVLSGYSAWVTGAPHAQIIVLGATFEDGRQILVALPRDLPGVSTPEPVRLIGLSASHTGEVLCDQVRLGREWLLAGPIDNVLSGAHGAKTGGLQTSTLAMGLASAALDYLETEAARRPELSSPAVELRQEQATLEADLLELAAGHEVCSNDDLRARANSLVLRASQATLAAAKGAGYAVGHPAGRWCREALFFLVWSCPQPVVAANLCELAGLSD